MMVIKQVTTVIKLIQWLQAHLIQWVFCWKMAKTVAKHDHITMR